MTFFKHSIYTQAYVRTNKHTYIVHTYTYIQTYMHTYIHIYIYSAYIYIYQYTPWDLWWKISHCDQLYSVSILSPSIPAIPPMLHIHYLFIGRQCYIILASESFIKWNTLTLIYVNCLYLKTNKHIVTGESKVNYSQNNEGWLLSKNREHSYKFWKNLQGLESGTLQKVYFD
jgi:hypothetical protein